MNIHYADIENGNCHNCGTKLTKGWIFLDDRSRLEKVLCDSCREIEGETKVKTQKINVKEVHKFLAYIVNGFKIVYEVTSSKNIMLPQYISKDYLNNLLLDPNIEITIRR